MHKFFVNKDQILQNKVIIIGEDVNHIVNVLRLNIDDEVLVGEKQNGQTFLCSIKEINKNDVVLDILSSKENSTESNIYIHILQGIPKGDKFEQVIQKCTEIGVSEFTPINMSRCVVKLTEKDCKKKLERWQKIAETAAKQSQRDIIPKVNNVENFKNIYEKLKEYDIVFLAYENEEKNFIKNELKNIINGSNHAKKIAVIIGPEGGISKEEFIFIKNNGAKVISLGKRILRTETAPLVVSSIILYELEGEEKI